MKQGTRGKIEASATIFGSSQDATSESTKSMTSKAGVLDACKQADRGDTEPPKQCGAPFRVELDAIEASPSTAETAEAPARDEGDKGYVCPKGLVSSGGKCARPGTVKSYSCRLGDLEGCTTQCANGNGPSCVTLGTMYDEGRRVRIDRTRGDGLWKQGCELGASNGCVGTAVKMFRGDGVPKDPEKAVAILRRECDAGSFYGCAQLALVDAFEVPKPTAQALPLGLRSCNGGEAQGCLAVGHMYKQGKGTPKDLARAKQFMERGCQEGRGIGIACGELGALYAAGDGVAKDDATAFRYLELGCHMPLGLEVCQAAANFSEQGRGTPKDLKRALGFLKHGCDEADKRACARLGHVFTRTSPPNMERARSFYKKACDLGDEESCKALQTLP